MKGKIALAWKDTDPLFIDKPGMYECKDVKLLPWMLWMLLNNNIMTQLFWFACLSSRRFAWFQGWLIQVSYCMSSLSMNYLLTEPNSKKSLFTVWTRDAEERLIQLGSKKIVQVQTGQGMFILSLELLPWYIPPKSTDLILIFQQSVWLMIMGCWRFSIMAHMRSTVQHTSYTAFYPHRRRAYVWLLLAQKSVSLISHSSKARGTERKLTTLQTLTTVLVRMRTAI